MNRNISIKNLLVAILLLIAFVNILTFFLLGEKPFYNFTTLILVVVSSLILCLLIKKADNELLTMVSVITLFYMLYIFSRSFSFLGFNQLIFPMLNLPMKASDVNNALIYIGLGTISFLCGQWGIYKIVHKFKILKYEKRAFGSSTSSILGMFLIVSLAQIYISVFLGNSVLGDLYYGVKHKFVGVLAVLFYTDMALQVAIISYYENFILNRLLKKSFVLILFWYFLILIILGSRQGGLAIIQHVFFCSLLMLGNFKAKIKSFIGFFIAIVILTLIAFPLGTAIRTAMLNEKDNQMITGVRLETSIPREIFERTDWAKYINFNPSAMLNRMNVVDTVALTLSLKPNKDLQDRYLNIAYAVKSAINFSVPGTVFENANINTALLWPFVYGARNVEYLYQKNYYESFYWTAWGLGFIFFGYTFGLFFLFVMGCAFQVAYYFIFKFFGRYSFYYGAWFLFNLYAFLGNMGLDHWLVVFQKTFVTLTVALIIKSSLSRLELIYKKHNIIKNGKWIL